jgi:hypothetical protein
MNNELEKIWIEVVVAYFKDLSRHLPVGNEEKHENFSQRSWSPGQDFNP